MIEKREQQKPSIQEIEELIERAAAAGVQAALQAVPRKEERPADRYKDAFMVMKNYRDARFCADNTADTELRIKTILKLRHIDAALKVIEERRKEQNREKEYEAFRLYFIEGVCYEQIAEQLETGKNTPRRWVTSVLKELPTLLWGLDGL